ncbi:MAG: hypothetical protein ACHQAX_09375 [Gammaproteobacteria bacterium]
MVTRQTLEKLVDNIKTVDDFLKPHENMMLIEYLAKHAIHEPAILKNSLSLYAEFMKKGLLPKADLYKLALAKFIRLICRNIIQTKDLDTIAHINHNPSEYFPELNESLTKELNLPTSLHEIFTRTSLRIKIGMLMGDVDSLSVVENVNHKTQYLRTMAVHPLYATHQRAEVNTLNQITAKTSQYLQGVPLLGTVTGAVQKVASAVGYDEITSTGRTLQLLTYARLIRTLHQHGKDIVLYTPPDKKAHIELLSFMYFEGNNNLRKDIAWRIDKIFEHHPNDIELHAFILKTFAPEPLGAAMYDMQSSPSNILTELNPTSCMHLLKSCTHFLRELDQQTINNIITKIQVQFEPSSESFVFNAYAAGADRWLAYLLCMGPFTKIKNVRIHYDKISLQEHMLLSYLMGSPKLVLSSTAPIYDAILSPLPLKCTFKNTQLNLGEVIIDTMTAHAQSVGITTLNVARSLSDADICTLLKNADLFNGTAPETQLYYHIITSKGITIDLTLSRTDINPGTLTLRNSEAVEEFLRLLILAFPQHWSELPTPKKDFVRPFAVVDNKKIDKIHCSQIKPTSGCQWLLIYTEDAANKKQFLYDINILPDAVEKGFFSKLGYGKPQKLTEQFPEFKPVTGSHQTYYPTRNNGTSSKDRSPSPHRR